MTKTFTEEELQERLASFTRYAAGSIEWGMDQALALLAGRAADYPRNYGYDRTGSLGRAWLGAKRVIKSGGKGATFLSGSIGNVMFYAPYVQGPDDQAWMHVGRWKTTEDIVRESSDDVSDILDEVGGKLVATLAS